MTAALKFTGDSAVLKRWQHQLKKAEGSARIVSASMAEEAIELIREGFATSKDPSGKDWSPLRIRSGQPLRDTGRLQASWHRRHVTNQGYIVESSVDYTVYHQRGTGIYGKHKRRIKPKKAKALSVPGVGYRASVEGTPQRRMVPDRGRLPRKWRERLAEAAQEVLTEIFEDK